MGDIEKDKHPYFDDIHALPTVYSKVALTSYRPEEDEVGSHRYELNVGSLQSGYRLALKHKFQATVFLAKAIRHIKILEDHAQESGLPITEINEEDKKDLEHYKEWHLDMRGASGFHDECDPMVKEIFEAINAFDPFLK